MIYFYFSPMNRLNFTILLLLLLGTVFGQGDQYTDFPEGVYYTHEDFLSKRSTVVPKMKKINICSGCNPLADSIVNHCYFLNEKNDIIKKAFAFSYKGELYFQYYGVKNNFADNSFLALKDDDRFCYRVLDRGRYLYIEMSGDVAGSVMEAVMIPAGAHTSNLNSKSILVYDYGQNKFMGFHGCPPVKKFLKNNYPEKIWDCPESRPKFFEQVRKLFTEFNTSE